MWEGETEDSGSEGINLIPRDKLDALFLAESANICESLQLEAAKLLGLHQYTRLISKPKECCWWYWLAVTVVTSKCARSWWQIKFKETKLCVFLIVCYLCYLSTYVLAFFREEPRSVEEGVSQKTLRDLLSDYLIYFHALTPCWRQKKSGPKIRHPHSSTRYECLIWVFNSFVVNCSKTAFLSIKIIGWNSSAQKM